MLSSMGPVNSLGYRSVTIIMSSVEPVNSLGYRSVIIKLCFVSICHLNSFFLFFKLIFFLIYRFFENVSLAFSISINIWQQHYDTYLHGARIEALFCQGTCSKWNWINFSRCHEHTHKNKTTYYGTLSLPPFFKSLSEFCFCFFSLGYLFLFFNIYGGGGATPKSPSGSTSG